jgi:biotin operon repressor
MSDTPLMDADIRAALRTRLRSTQRRHPGTVIVDELGICRGEVRIDVALINGSLHGYEIKSDRDTLRRLNGQVELYGKVLDKATLVVGDRYLDMTADLLPDWWGLLRVTPGDKGLHFETVRRPRLNPDRDARALAEFLWLDDALALLKRHGLDRGVRTKPRRFIWDRISESLDIEVIADAVRDHLKSRTALPTVQ